MHRDWWNGSRLGLFSFKADLARTLLIAAIVAGWLAVIVPTGGAPSSTGNKHPDKLTEGAMRLLYANCLSCHNAEKHKGGLELTSRAAALKGGIPGSQSFVQRSGKYRAKSIGNCSSRVATVRLTAIWQLVILPAEPVYCLWTPTE